MAGSLGGLSAAWRGGKAPRLAQALNELGRLLQAVEIEEVGFLTTGCTHARRGHRGRAIVGPTHGDGGMGAIRPPDDQIRVSAAANPHDRDRLAGKRVMRMGDGHRFRRRLG